MRSLIFFFNDPATTEIYPLSLHDALPSWQQVRAVPPVRDLGVGGGVRVRHHEQFELLEPLHHLRHAGDGVAAVAHHEDRKSTRLNSSHANISYAVFCLKKKNRQPTAYACP